MLETCKHLFLDCQEGLYGRNCLQNCSMTCGDPGRCDMRTGHCNGGCQVGWTGAMCETGYHLTINNTHDNSHENIYIMKPSYISTINDNSLYNIFMANTWFWTAEKHVMKVKAESPKHVSTREKITQKFHIAWRHILYEQTPLAKNECN